MHRTQRNKDPTVLDVSPKDLLLAHWLPISKAATAKAGAHNAAVGWQHVLHPRCRSTWLFEGCGCLLIDDIDVLGFGICVFVCTSMSVCHWHAFLQCATLVSASKRQRSHTRCLLRAAHGFRGDGHYKYAGIWQQRPSYQGNWKSPDFTAWIGMAGQLHWFG